MPKDIGQKIKRCILTSKIIGNRDHMENNGQKYKEKRKMCKNVKNKERLYVQKYN